NIWRTPTARRRAPTPRPRPTTSTPTTRPSPTSTRARPRPCRATMPAPSSASPSPRPASRIRRPSRTRRARCSIPTASRSMPAAPDRTELAPGLDISRVVTGLWQVADMERGGQKLDLDRAAQALGDYAAAGFDTFDMADHYGSAEDITGRFRQGVAAGRFKP